MIFERIAETALAGLLASVLLGIASLVIVPLWLLWRLALS